MSEGDNLLPIPAGHRVLLPGRGVTFVREVAGPPDAPVLVLVHGWMASGGLNWFPAFEPLSRHFRILAPDNRGHGRGITTRGRFTVTDVADDIAALLDALGVEQAVIAGYSLGGPISQMLWKRRPEKVAGLLFCATGFDLVQGGGARMALAGAASIFAAGMRAGGIPAWVPTTLAREMTLGTRAGARPETIAKWARAEMQRHSWRMVSEAGLAIGTYSSGDWVGTIDVPTGVVVTQRDRAVPAHAQYGLAASIPGARVHRYDGGHISCLEPAFADMLTIAAVEVAGRAGLLRTDIDLRSTPGLVAASS